MSERITRALVDGAFRAACVAAQSAGIDVAGWTVEAGSAINGVAWRLVANRPDTGRWPVGASGGFLGRTMSDAHARLDAYREAWLIVGDQRHKSE